jgi:hypothetical protein
MVLAWGIPPPRAVQPQKGLKWTLNRPMIELVPPTRALPPTMSKSSPLAAARRPEDAIGSAGGPCCGLAPPLGLSLPGLAAENRVQAATGGRAGKTKRCLPSVGPGSQIWDMKRSRRTTSGEFAGPDERAGRQI